MWIIVTPSRGMYSDIVERLITHGASLLTVSDSSAEQASKKISGKLEIILQMLNPKLFGLRKAWTEQDSLFVIGWHVIPILLLIKMGWLPKPKFLVSLGCFVHSQKVRQIINAIFRRTKFPGLRFVAFSQRELKSLVEGAGVPESSVLFHLWRQDLNGRPDPEEIQAGDYIFSGGYSNRDYELLVSVLKETGIPAVIVASKMNNIPDVTGSDIRVYRELGEAEFEKLLAKSRLVVLPLKESGEACGQSVLLRVLRNHKPLVITRHESVEGYLGTGYPGFVQPSNSAELAATIQQAYSSDGAFLKVLRTHVRQSQEKLSATPHPGDEVYEWISGLA